MDKIHDALFLKLLQTFKAELAEHLQTISGNLIALEKNPPPEVFQPLIETTFRVVHNIKGASRAVSQDQIGKLCQAMETVLHKAKLGAALPAPARINALFQATEMLGVMLREIDQNEKSYDDPALSGIMEQLDQGNPETAGETEKNAPPPVAVEPAMPPEKKPDEKTRTGMAAKTSPPPKSVKTVPATPPPAIQDKPVSRETVRVATSKLATLLSETDEFIPAKESLKYYLRELRKIKNREIIPVIREMEQFSHFLSRRIDDLSFDLKTTLMFPFSFVLDVIPKIVRDLGKEYDKEINLAITGGNIEIDRRILEEIREPVIHLVRNCIDHGLETPEIRVKAGKPPAGNLEVTVKQDSSRHITLTIRDDGAGIDRGKVIQSALKMGVISRELSGRLTDQEVLGLIFKSGVSTSQFITTVSGRGLGMAIVAEKVGNMEGQIQVESVPGKGTCFVIGLPVTVSNFRGILVQVIDQFFIIPTPSVEKAIRVNPDDVKKIEGRKVILHNEESIALIRLGDLLGIPARILPKEEQALQPALVLSQGAAKVAIGVDHVIGEQEVIVKNMGPQLVHVRNISGVTISGNGQVIPILHVPELMESAARLTAPRPSVAGEEGSAAKKILVVEDSVTLRSLLKNILESAGYEIKTAVDGMEGFQFLKNETFDMVITDIEMPGMDGFELTSRIRQEKPIAEIPVILVTALDSPDDRRRGMDAGANGYIIKGNFEQSNLMDMIQQLI